MTLAEINPLAELTDGSFVALDAHMEMENEAVGRQKKLLRGQLGDRRGRHPRDLRALRLRAQRRPRSTPPTTAA